MIQIHITPTKVKKVLFIFESEIEQDFDFAAWQVIRPLVDQIDRLLTDVSAEALRHEKIAAASSRESTPI